MTVGGLHIKYSTRGDLFLTYRDKTPVYAIPWPVAGDVLETACRKYLLHAGVLTHSAPPVPTQQGEGYFARTLCRTTDLTVHPSGILPLLCCYYY